METCYKAFRTGLVRSIPLRSERFGIEPEIAIKLAQRQVRISEMPINYHGRTYDEGKKIGLWDAVKPMLVILRLLGQPRSLCGRGSTDSRYVGVHTSIQRLDGGCHSSFCRISHTGTWGGDRQSDPETVGHAEACMSLLTLILEHLARLHTRFQNRPNLEIHRCDLTNPGDFALPAGSTP